MPVFGYPITPARNEGNRDTGETYRTQWFERNRFELHSENQPPYDVLLGRLGDDLLLARGVNWHRLPPAEASAGCMWFGETRHNVCDQGNGLGFRTYWMTHGLEFDGRQGKSYDENLALFGYPLTEAYMDTNPDGDHVLMQWFERARFEWHPQNPDQYKVLLGRLSAEMLGTPGPRLFDRVNIYLIAEGDNGISGKKIGCNDSIVPVEVAIGPTTAPLTAGLEALFAIDTRTYGQTGLTNALYQSDLRVERITIEQGKATINLSGRYQLGGVCDNPRFEAQIKETALQFSTVDQVSVYINGRSLEDILSLR